MTSTIKTREVDELTDSGEFCGICRRQVSRYMCPSCNLVYCSLICFRSELHSQCSEVFYQKEIETGIKTDDSRSKEERIKMLELLQRIQDEDAVDETGLFHSDEENEEDNLADRFSAIDISSASTDELLRLLNEKEKYKFFAALKDPSSGLMQELLGSADKQPPWWEVPSDDSQPPLNALGGVKPDLMMVPINLIKASRGPSLLYNICVVLLAYAYVTRHLSMSPLSSTTNDNQDQREARKLLLRFAPFLGDRKSKSLHVSMADAVVSFWSQFKPGGIDKKGILLLLEDVEELVRPRRIVVKRESSSGELAEALTADHPFYTTILAISDMSSLFSASPDSSIARRRSHVVMKLTFYAAHILAAPSSRLHALADEVHLLSESVSGEAD